MYALCIAWRNPVLRRERRARVGVVTVRDLLLCSVHTPDLAAPTAVAGRAAARVRHGIPRRRGENMPSQEVTERHRTLMAGLVTQWRRISNVASTNEPGIPYEDDDQEPDEPGAGGRGGARPIHRRSREARSGIVRYRRRRRSTHRGAREACPGERSASRRGTRRAERPRPASGAGDSARPGKPLCRGRRGLSRGISGERRDTHIAILTPPGRRGII